MSLRTKFLALFFVLGVVPLLALGILSYVRGTKALEDLLAQRTAAIASRAAETISRRYARALSDFLFLANNQETRRLLDDGLDAEADTAVAEAKDFLDSAWETVGSSWRWTEIRAADGAVLHRLGEPQTQRETFEAPAPTAGRIDYIVTRPIEGADGESGPSIGSVRGSLSLLEILPQGELTAGFGEMGHSVVIDREGERILFPPRLANRRSFIASLLGPSGWSMDPGLLVDSAGRFSYSEEGTTRVASFLSLDDPPWTVISSESLDEFAAPFARTGSFNLLVVLFVTVAISVAFIVVARRATDSLKRLTAAADEMATGNLDPPLPPGGGDEVGKLSGAFSMMVERVRDMMRRVEENRHMSAIGEFAAQLSHEIRNPLTSIKLNLQRLDRGVRDARMPPEFAKAVRISLKEAKRLDGTVRGVLSLSRTRAPRRNPEPLHDVLRSALDALAPQLEEEKVTVETEFSACNDIVLGDRELLKGAFLNLFLNSVEVMDMGGVLRIFTQNVSEEGRPSFDAASTPNGSVLVRISDDGPGVPDQIREQIFDSFFTTKEEGSGFGLPLAVRVMEEHGGTLTLAEPEAAGGGATFLVILPVAGPEKNALAFGEDAATPGRDATASGEDSA